MGRDSTINVDTVRVNCGYVFFTFFHCTKAWIRNAYFFKKRKASIQNIFHPIKELLPKDAEKRKKVDLDKQKKKCADFIKDKLLPGKDDHRIWTNLLKKRTNYWSGKELLGKSTNSDGKFCLISFYKSDFQRIVTLHRWPY